MANIFIVGSGVVGTATGRGFVRFGHEVTFVDINAARIEALRREGFSAADQVDLPAEPSFVFLSVPTPFDGQGYDLSALMSASASVGVAIRGSEAFHTVVVRSTVPPGTCDGVVGPILERSSGKVAGEGFGLASNPEFLRAASAEEDFLFPWMTVIASSSRRTIERLVDLFQPFGGEMRTFLKTAEAEMAKCCHNLFNATKISFWNEMWDLSRHFGLDADAVASTVSRSAEGSINPDYGIRGGAPYGGACLPKDTKGFLSFAAQEGMAMPLLGAVIHVNDRMETRLHSELAGRLAATNGRAHDAPHLAPSLTEGNIAFDS